MYGLYFVSAFPSLETPLRSPLSVYSSSTTIRFHGRKAISAFEARIA